MTFIKKTRKKKFEYKKYIGKKYFLSCAYCGVIADIKLGIFSKEFSHKNRTSYKKNYFLDDNICNNGIDESFIVKLSYTRIGSSNLYEDVFLYETFIKYLNNEVISIFK